MEPSFDYIPIALKIGGALGSGFTIVRIFLPPRTTLEIFNEHGSPVRDVKVFLLDEGMITEPPCVEHAQRHKHWILFRKDIGATLSITDMSTGRELYRDRVRWFGRKPVTVTVSSSINKDL